MRGRRGGPWGSGWYLSRRWTPSSAARRGVDRLQPAAPTDLEIVGMPRERHGRIELTVSVRIGAIEIKPGGLPLNERERFDIYIPADYPFRCRPLKYAMLGLPKFPHVCWTVVLCLYQSSTLEWNPSDGMFGFFDRLKLWLERAAAGDMDPMDGPLEPPTTISRTPGLRSWYAPMRQSHLVSHGLAGRN